MRAYLVPTTDPPVPLPDGTPWPAAGAEVEVDHYVRRRLADGDLKPGTPPAEAAGQDAGEDAGEDAGAPAGDTPDAGTRRRKPREG